MSKTFETNAQKALTMASGIKKHIAEVTHLGIKTEGLDTLEAEANKAIEMIQEVDALRQTIKNYFPMEQWEKFGIMDKR